MVRMITGAAALTGSRNTPKCPATPTAVSVDNRITTNVPTVPPVVRSTATTARSSAANMAGMTTGTSFVGASANAMFRSATPVDWISSSGYRSRYSRSSSRTASTVAGSSSVDSPGSEMRTFTPADIPSAATRRPRRRGSSIATALARSASSGVISPAGTRSSTINSSPSAHVCWKLGNASTRVECGICHASSVRSRRASNVRAVNTSPDFGRTTNSALSLRE
jgi:hypothetical protein